MVAIKDGAGLFSPLADDRTRLGRRLEERCRETLGDQDSQLAEALHHALASPGKFVRSLLMLDACRAVGGDPERVFPAALGVEYGHMASLIHDDIMDGDTSRRGQDAAHIKYGVDTAVLTGDALIFLAYLGHLDCFERGVSAERTLSAIRTLSLTCLAMCQGQALETAAQARLDLSEEDYFAIIGSKTAAFCRAVCEIGAILGGGSDAEIEQLGLFGHHLGVAFQIVDDLLCYDTAGTNLGKSALSDLRNQRVTLPIIYALRDGSPDERARIAALFSPTSAHHHANGSADGGNLLERYSRLVEILQHTHAVDHARALAQTHTQCALTSLDLLQPSEPRDRMTALATLLMVRDR